MTVFLLVSVTSFAGEPDRVNIINSSVTPHNIVFLIPKDLGLYRKYGIDVDVIQITGGLSMRTLVSGSAPMAFTGSTLAITTARAGFDVVILLGITNRLTYDIWARPEIKSASALRGKKFGIATFGGPSHTAAVLMLKHFKLDDKRDGITFLTIGSEPARVQALLSGGVDATVADPSVAAALRDKGFSYLGNFADLGIPVTGNTLVSTKRYVRENPGIVETVIKATVEGIAYTLNPANRSYVIAVLAKHLRLSEKRAMTGYEDLVRVLERKPYPNMEGIRNTVETMPAWSSKGSPIKAEDIVDVSILTKLEEAGFMDRLQR
jgi:NitT/TauT family transport system substrate-binding protein